MNKFCKHFIIICAILFASYPGKGTVLLVSLTPANPTTMSTGREYYTAGRTYDFTVNAVDLDVTAWTQVTNVRLTISNGAGDIIANTNALSGIVSGAATDNTNITYDVSGTYNNFTATFHVAVSWAMTSTAYSTGRAITARVVTNQPGSNFLEDTESVNYGVCTAMKVTSFAQSGVAADGYVNQYYTNFNITGTLVYDFAGSGGAGDEVPTVSISNTTLYLDGAATTATGGAADNTPSYAVTNATVPLTSGSHLWTAFITGTGTYGTEVSANSLSIICDEVQVTSIAVINGGGVDIDTTPGQQVYFRSILMPGTQIRVTARMRYTGGGTFPVIGNTTIRVHDNQENIDYYVTIADGSNTGTVSMATYPSGVTSGDTEDYGYYAYQVSGGITDDEQNIASRIYQYGNGMGGSYTIIRWDNGDPPGTLADFTTWGSVSSTADTLTLSWTALNNPSLDDSDGDFYTYRIYYRVNGTTVWTTLDRNTPLYGYLGAYGTGSVDITDLQPLQTYDYMVSAVDVFGNEVAAADMLTYIDHGSYATQPSSTVITVSDGITNYTFNPASAPAIELDPVTNYALRRSAVKIDLDIVTAGTTPDTVELIVADNNTDIAGAAPAGQYGGSGASDLITDATYYTITCTRTGPNTWTGYISTTDPLQGATLMTVGTTIRFIIKLTYGAGVVYYDSLNEPAPGAWTAREFRFYIANEPAFTPWPTRMLNNVITDDNPVAYPSYYLTDDAYVTITAYDIKGRPVAVLLENAWRPAGQNIKEDGWAGTNKNRKKLGVGLYYIRILAKRASDGKVIIDKYSKIVMAK